MDTGISSVTTLERVEYTLETNVKDTQPTELGDYLPEATNFSECTRHLLPLMDAMDVLSGRWKFTILLALWFGGKMRFKELQRNVRGITGKVLSKELKSLEEHGILTRTVFDTAPISVVYELTDYGKTLDKVMIELREWGIQHRKKMIGK